MQIFHKTNKTADNAAIGNAADATAASACCGGSSGSCDGGVSGGGWRRLLLLLYSCGVTAAFPPS
jgi:hypothetical protein